ncbi:hypothetical protein [Methanobrevibacter sp.]|uniref:hypothetical protein n=1 Tax=Methanobrevibacter sp. TaxID=66852 RepID=UPI0025FA7A74|nr:hypothetical protein [Methanobrevibacter sp.]MBQ2832893.1 hypothetical protein [Methanobrevibacter sp.]
MGEGLTPEISNTWAYNGNYSLKLIRNENNRAWYRFRTSYELQDKTITCIAKIYSPEARLSCHLLQIDNSNEALETITITVPTSDDIQTITITSTSLENIAEIQFNFANNTNNTNSAFYIDDIWITAQ